MPLSFDELKDWLDQQKNSSTSPDKSTDEQFDELKDKLNDSDYKEVDLPEPSSKNEEIKLNDNSPVQEYEAKPEDQLNKPIEQSQQGFNIGTDEELRSAQNKKRLADLFTNLNIAGQYIGAGLNRGATPITQPFEQQFKQNEAIVTNLKDRIANQKNDPNSAISKTFQDYAEKQLGHKFQGPQSAASLEAAMPYLFKGKEMELGRQLKEKEFGLKHEENLAKIAQVQAYKDIARQDKQNIEAEKMAQKLKDDLDPNKARGGNLAFNQKKVDQSDRLLGLINDSNGNIRNLDQRQMEELAIGLNSMLSNASTGSVEQVKALMPSSAIGSAAKLQEWLSNEPTGTNQLEFVKRMAETVNREREIASDQVKKAQVQRLSAHKTFKEKHPEAYNAQLQAYGINPSEIDQQGRYKSSRTTENKDFVKVRSPQGDLHLIPKDQVESAVKAGGKVEE